jgi:predicted ATPase
VPRSELIGREDELARLEELLRTQRIVTLVGAAGIGKTRLALELCDRAAASWTGGVRRIELAPVTAQHDVAIEVAAQLGCPSLDVAAVRLGAEQNLLLLDNCEHLLEQAAEAGARLIDLCPRLHLLATSRTPLAVDGEHVFVVSPLGLPATNDDDDIARAAAVRLFSARVRASGAAWDASVEHLHAVAELCRRLDGIPLAIELAAARARALTAAEMLRHVDRSLDLLRRGTAGAAARHASLRTAIDASYRLLGDEEKAFFRGLGIFAGSFDAALAHAVCAVPGSDRLHSLELVARLVDHSLVVVEHRGAVTGYRLLDSLRRYARELAAERGEVAALQERFVTATVDVADEITLAGIERWSGAVLERLGVEFVNLTSAVEPCIASDATCGRAFRLLLPLWGLLHQGRSPEVAELCKRALARWPGKDEPLRAEILAVAANAALGAGRPVRAAELAEQCLALDAASAVAPIVAHRTLGMTALRTGRPDAARVHFEHGQQVAAAHGVGPFRRELAVFVAWLDARDGTDADAVAALDAVAEEAAAAGDHVAEAWARTTAAQILLTRGRLADAQRTLRTIRDLRERSDLRWGEHPTRRLEALLATLEVGWSGTRASWRHAIESSAAAADLGELALTLETAAVLAHRAGDATVASALAAAIPLEAKGTVLGNPFGDEFAQLVWAKAIAAPPADRGWSAAALRRVRDVLATEPDATPAPETSRERTPAAGGEAADAGPGAARTARFRRAGDAWQVRFAEREVEIRHMKGLADLARLLAHPDADVHCLDLMGGSPTGDAGPALDEKARRAYRERVRDLQSEIEDAHAAHDLHRAERAEAELDTLVEQLAQGFGLGGRARRTGAAVDRARAAVTWRIRAAIKHIAAVHPELGRHLPNAIRTGAWCSYRPESLVAWGVDVPPDA